MTEHDYRRARATIISVTIGRVACVCVATYQAIKGDFTGAVMFLAAVPALHFFLPVTR